MFYYFQAVEDNSPAFEAGLREDYLITHINDETIHGLLHTQVVRLILKGKEELRIRCVPLDNTSITMGARKKGAHPGKMARRSKKKNLKEKSGDKKKSRSLFRRLSTKRAAAQQEHVSGHGLVMPGSPLTPNSAYRASPFSKSWSFGDTSNVSFKTGIQSSPLSHTWGPDSGNSSNSSPSSSSPNSPASQLVSPSYNRPSTLAGLKHKRTQSLKSPHRRKSVHNIPLSPLARTPSPSPMPASPTRSPSPLAFSQGQGQGQGHQVGASSQAQKTIPSHLVTNPSQALAKRPSFSKHKTEPGSPLLRRALSPDRLHPNSAEKSQRKSSLQEKKSLSLDPT